jgi:hypothetical protein
MQVLTHKTKVIKIKVKYLVVVQTFANCEGTLWYNRWPRSRLESPKQLTRLPNRSPPETDKPPQSLRSPQLTQQKVIKECFEYLRGALNANAGYSCTGTDSPTSSEGGARPHPHELLSKSVK